MSNRPMPARAQRVATPAAAPAPAPTSTPAPPAAELVDQAAEAEAELVDQAAEAEAELVAYLSTYPAICYPGAPGGAVQFLDGRFETADPALIAFLDERETCSRAA